MLSLTVKCRTNFVYDNITLLKHISRCFHTYGEKVCNRVIIFATPKRTYCHLSSLKTKHLCTSRLSASMYENRKSKSSAISSTGMPHFVPYMEGFSASYQDVIDDLTVKDTDIPPAVAERLRRIMDYNILGGKKVRGLCVPLAYHMLSKKSPHPQEMKLANILGWCVEMLHGYFIICDDIMDDGRMRRGKLCWYRLPDVGFESINDALLVETSMFKLLKTHFSTLKCYHKIQNEFIEVTRKTIHGQSLDMILNPTKQKPILEKFTPDHYRSVVNMKTSHYTFCLPVHLSMHLIGSFDKDDYEIAETVCLKLGYLFQMQDDYLDIYGKLETTGKSGSDIREGKCTWFSATALQRCTEDQKKIIKENYGIDDSVAVQKILELYDEMSLKDEYLLMEKKLYVEISSLISEIGRERNTWNLELFKKLLNTIYGRKK